MEKKGKVLSRELLERRHKSARGNLLLIIIFTVINILLLITNTNLFFLFSAYIPYAFVDLGMYFCGLYPAEYYGNGVVPADPLSLSAFAIFIGMALVPLVLYFLCWIFSKKNYKTGWLIFALVLFSVDTVLMIFLWGFEISNIIDILFHAWVIISFSMGISASSKLKDLPPENIYLNETRPVEPSEMDLNGSAALRIADDDVKHRVLLEKEVFCHSVVYRRVKRVNELVIDGRVYDEYEALVETKHSLKANFGGHIIEVGFDGLLHSYIKVDDVETARKLRLY